MQLYTAFWHCPQHLHTKSKYEVDLTGLLIMHHLRPGLAD